MSQRHCPTLLRRGIIEFTSPTSDQANIGFPRAQHLFDPPGKPPNFLDRCKPNTLRARGIR